LAYEPAVLLLDEPLANLDARLREEMRFELRAIQERSGVTAVCVTHDQSEAMVLSDHIIVMSNGRIEQQGPPQEIYERPRTEFAARFIGLSNLLDVAEVSGSDGVLSGISAFGPIRFLAGNASPAKVRKLSIRPEDVEIHRSPPADRANVVSATVQSRIYQGECVALFTLAGSQEFRVHVGRSLGIAAGEQVHLVLPPERLIALEG
jgi:putative spermidine/putrescine transport system ATP-binding protein/spermidine/putrescine transport system ATP-binding protein